MKEVLAGNVICNFFSENDSIFQPFDNEFSKRDFEMINNCISIDMKDYLFAIFAREYPLIQSKDIPMYSSFFDATDKLLLILDSFGKYGLDYTELGKCLRETSTGNDTAYIKYGETHSKLASMLGLVTIQKRNKRHIAVISNLGEFYIENATYREKIIYRSILRLRIIQYLLKKASLGQYNCGEVLRFLSENTKIRRTQDIKRLITLLGDNTEIDLRPYVNNIVFQTKEQ